MRSYKPKPVFMPLMEYDDIIMKIYIWEWLSYITNNSEGGAYGGGLLVVAKDMNQVNDLLSKTLKPSDWGYVGYIGSVKEKPDHIFNTDETETKVIIF